jgi:hypothetical protein
MVTKSNGGCAFGRESRVMIENIKSDINDIKGLIGEVKKGQTDLFNHQSTRIPQETVDKLLAQANQIKWLFGILGGIITGLIVGLIVHYA